MDWLLYYKKMTNPILYKYFLIQRVLLVFAILKRLDELSSQTASSGNLTSKTDANGKVTNITDSNARTTTYQYNAIGNKISMTMPDGTIINYERINGTVVLAH